jgi:glycopeptide antibiotics resistance protein
MKYQYLLFLYLAVLVVMVVVPLGELNAALSDTSVLSLRLDYLGHVVLFAPLVVLWRLGFPGHSVWKIAAAGVLLAVGLEGVQYVLPYRNWNVNDAVGNGFGVGIGCLVLGIRSWRKQ